MVAMKCARYVFFILFIAAIWAGAGCRPNPAVSGGSPEAAATSVPGPTNRPALEYIERVTGGAAEDARLPMITAVHGLGDRPEHFEALFDDLPLRARVILPRAPKPYSGGGSWFDSAGYCRSAVRDGDEPGNRWNYVGFRLARAEGPSPHP